MRLTLIPVPAVDAIAPIAATDLEPATAGKTERKRKPRGTSKPKASDPGFNPDDVVGE
jgi:hypothetical protein